MTARDIYEGVLMELNKVHAPACTVEEFVYFLNKAILAFVNERYNFYAVNQQLSDDLRALIAEYEMSPVTNSDIFDDGGDLRYIQGGLEVTDYYHILTCFLFVRNTISNKTKRFTAKRWTHDMDGAIHNNEYLKPAIHRPYFSLLPGNPEEQNTPTFKLYIGTAVQYIEPSTVRFQYLKLPAPAALTDNQVYNLAADESTVLEFPDYLKNEFVKRVTSYQLEETRDQRISTFPALNQEILPIPLEKVEGYTQQPTDTQSQ